ncbi:MAG TPA: CaiB/BaiF CoA-transferase family protein [Acidimicrobiales bacterium]|nr:CaiB/BaiF CoA-transferase family protein [Acidimicrobiales bacterium]
MSTEHTRDPRSDSKETGPLSGIRVLDVGTRISAPFCAGLLGELGADVIKVELPGGGDFMRTIGPFVDSDETEAGYSLFWAVEGRGRKSVTCDLRTPEGQALFRRLAAHADVVCENFRPGTMEEWGLGPDALDPRLVFVRISVFGQDGPYSRRPGLDRLGIAYGGLLHLTGERDRPPVRPGVTISDYLTGVFAAMAAVAGLYHRDVGSTATGAGAVIDAPLYGAVLRVLEWTLAGYDQLGVVRSREGNRLPNSAPLDNYPTADGAYVCIVAGSDANFRRLCRAMDRGDLITDDRFSTLARRAARGDEINGIVQSWTSGLTASEVETICVAHDVPVGIAYSAADIFADPHMTARKDLIDVEDPVVGTVRQQAPFPRFVGRRTPTPTGAPRLGADNDEVWTGLVGVTADELKQLRDHRVV